MDQGTTSPVTRILARKLATELTGEALRAVRQPTMGSTLLSTGSFMDEEDQ